MQEGDTKPEAVIAESSKWEQYQEDCAKFFRRLQLHADVEKRVEGVRASHDIDVWVTGKFGGIDVRWAVECKAWKTSIPQEKVSALRSIVDDVGADKGILMSEVGFQSGAIRAAKKTNLLLTSLADLGKQLEDSKREGVIATLHWRTTGLKLRLQRVNRRLPDYDWRHMPAMGKLVFLEMALAEAPTDAFPIVYGIGPDEERLVAADFDQLVERAQGILGELEPYVADADATTPEPAGGQGENP